MINPDANAILTSLLDTDAYKLYMQQAVYHLYPSINVKAEFRCRGKEKLGEYAGALADQVRLMEKLVLTDSEYHYLASLPFFKVDYLDWLRTFRFRADQVSIANVNDDLQIHIYGPWHEIILWEVPLLAILSELVHRQRSPHIVVDQAVDQLHKKLADFTQDSGDDLDLSGFRLMDFGTRRRFSSSVHRAIVSTLKTEFAYFVGTSNYALAHQFNLPPMGTQAHEWFQAHQQIVPKLGDSQRAALQAWLDEYPNSLGIALTDCITMDAFLRDFNLPFAAQYSGMRHDSGDPVRWGEKAIRHYEQLGIDPLTKTLVFSDNLDLKKALYLYRHFHEKIQLSFGIGTRLTCDIPGVSPLNIVIKLVECDGKPVAKLSVSPGKTICQDRAFIQELQKAFALLPLRQVT